MVEAAAAGNSHAVMEIELTSEALRNRCAAAGLAVVSAAEHEALLAEVRTLADRIDMTRREIAAIGADEAVKSHVSAATDELDAVVMHTAEATETILDVCETLDEAFPQGDHDVVAAATARIYEACSFQDITGQRVAKVVQTLQAIEVKIAQILHVFGNDLAPPKDLPTPPRAGDALLNGPQHRHAAMNQGAIDAMLDDIK